MPFWAMGALGLLPVWAFLYLRGIQPVEEAASGPLAVGATEYTGCTSCHGAAGQGGAGRPLANGEVLLTFPKIEDMLNLVYTGSEQYELQGVTTWGDPEREGGAHGPGAYNGSYMPAQGEKYGGALTEAEILGVVCHERYEISGAEPTGEFVDEYETWCSPGVGDVHRPRGRIPDLRHHRGNRHRPTPVATLTGTPWPRGRSTSSSSVADPPARRPGSGWRAMVTTSRSSSGGRIRATRRVAMHSRHGR